MEIIASISIFFALFALFNIRKRRQAEIALKNTTTQLENTIEQLMQWNLERERAEKYLDMANMMIVALDIDGKVTFINKKTTKILGYSKKELIGKYWVETVVPDDNKINMLRIFKQVINGKMIEHLENEVLTRDGERRLIAWDNSFLKDDSNKIIGSLSAGEDITEHRQMHQLLFRRKKILEAVSIAAERFLKKAHWEESIGEVLGKIGERLDMCRIYVFENSEKNDGSLLMNHRYEWFKMDNSVFVNNSELQGLPYKIFDNLDLADTLARGKSKHASFQELEEHQHRFFKSLNTKSFLIVPIFAAQKWWGFMGFDEICAEQRWTQVEKEGLSAVADIFGAAIQRNISERILRESEERTRLLLSSTGEGIYGIDLHGICTICNPACLKFLGYSNEKELLGKNVHDLIHHTRVDGTAYPVMECKIYEAFHKGYGTHADDEIFWRADGSSFPVEYYSYPVYRDGKIVGAVVSFVDIAKRKQSESALRESEARHRALFSQAPISLWEEDFTAVNAWLTEVKASGIENLDTYLQNDPEALHYALRLLKILDVNQASLTLFEAESKEELFKNLSSVFTERSYQTFAGELLAIWRGQSQVSLEFSAVTLKGRRIDCLLQWVVPVENEEVNFSKVIVAIVDITERKQVEKALRESEKRHRNLFEQTPIAIYEDDFTAVGKWLDNLRAEGVHDLSRYLQNNSTFLNEVVQLVNVLDANESALGLFEAETKEELIENSHTILAGKSYQTFIGQLLAIWENKPRIELEFSGETLKGRAIDGLLQWAAPLDENEQLDLSKVIIAIIDITKRKEAEKALKISEQNYRSLVELSPETMIVHRKGKILFGNQTAARLLGAESSEALVGKSIYDLIHDDFRNTDDDDERMGKILLSERGHAAYVEQKLLLLDGHLVDVEEIGSRVLYEGEEAVQIVIRDITERRRVEERLRLAATVFDNTAEAIIITDKNNKIITVNPAFVTITGYGLKEVIGKNPRMLSSGLQDAEFYKTMWDSLVRDHKWRGEIWNRRKNGEIFPEWLSIATILNEKGEIIRYVALFSDITKRKKAEELIQYQANHDALTNLPNRILFMDRLSQAINKVNREIKKVALMFIDLDRFKWVNDTLGHSAGDELLQETAQRLLSCVRRTDTVARLGGDEFVIILPDVMKTMNAGVVAQKILDYLAKPFYLNNNEIFISGSIGITIFPNDATETEELLKNADTAMYRAKESGRNTYQFFTAEMNTRAAHRMQLESELHHALENQEFKLFYQPIVTLKSKKIQGAEALLRWHHPTRGLILPEEFLPLAEETGLISQIGTWVVETVCHQLAEWKFPFEPNFYVSINLSVKQCRHVDFKSSLDKIIEATQVPACSLILEVTENVSINELEDTVAALHDIRNKGARIAIDDFGTGHSSLNRIKHFPVDILKIDRSFIRDVSKNEKDNALVEAILKMAHSLGIKVVAEGIEIEDQLEFLHAQGCDFGQGYYFCEPLPPELLEQFIRTFSW